MGVDPNFLATFVEKIERLERINGSISKNKPDANFNKNLTL